MDSKSKQFVEFFFSIVFSGVILYLITFISEPKNCIDVLHWSLYTGITTIFTFLTMYYILNLKAVLTKDFVFKICFMFFIIFTILCLTRLISFIQEPKFQNFIDPQYNILIVFLIADSFTLLLDGVYYNEKNINKWLIGSSIFIIILVIILVVFKSNILYGGIL